MVEMRSSHFTLARALGSLFFIPLFLILLSGSMAHAAYQSRMGELLLSANQAHIQTDANLSRTIILTGNVQMIYRGQHVTADEIRINQQTKEIDAIGHVVFLTPTVKMEGDRVTLNTENNTGQVYNAYLEAGQVQLTGSRIEKTGADTYAATDGNYTACSTCPPGWSFSGAKIEAQLGSYTYIKNPIFRIGGFPILWLPYLLVPLKSERQTGLLYPTFESSGNGGFAIQENFFWAIDPSHDATFGLKNYAYRGTKALAQYRYVLDPNDHGVLDTTYMQDRQPAGQPGVAGSTLERYYIKYDHLYELPDHYTQRVNLDYVADIFYPRDFNTEVAGYGEPALENRASLTKNTESTSTTAEAAYYINLLHSTYTPDNRDAVHRAPEINTVLVPQSLGLGNLQFLNEANYTYFQRNSTSFNYQYPTSIDPVTGRQVQGTTPVDPNSIFNPDNDVYRTGQRLMVSPRLEYPFAIGVVDFLPAVGYNESHYYFQNTSPISTGAQPGSAISNQPEAQRRYMRTEVTARTRLSHVYGDLKDPGALRYKHEIMPEITYAAIPWLQSTSHPFFGGTQDILPYAARDIPISDRDLLQFDYRDRLTQRDVVTVAVTNRITRKRWLNNQPDYKQIASLRLSQSYDFYENYRSAINTRHPYSDISALLDVRLDHFEIDSFSQFYPYQNIAQTATRARIFSERGNFFQFEYDKQYQLLAPINNIQTYQLDTSSANETLSIGSGLLTPIATLLGSLQYSISTGQLSSYILSTDLRPPGNCWVLSFRYTKNFQQPGDLGFAFNLLFDGNTATPIGKM